jgi:predicted CXXCH cytochrome family protein
LKWRAVALVTLALVATVLAAAGPWVSARSMPQDAAAQAAGKAHPELPDTEAETCLVCHDEVAKGEMVHVPAAAGMCTTCHVFEGKGDDTTVRLSEKATSDNTQPLCVSCHDDIATALKAEHVHVPAGAGDCLLCHEPHKSANKKLLKFKGIEGCAACHGDVADDLNRKSKHAPAAADCSLCHSPHASAHPAQLRERTNTLCLACHLITGKPEPAPRTTLFGRQVEPELLNLLSLERGVVLDAQQRFGHPVDRHPVSGPKDPLDETKPFTCLSCHGAHGSDGPKLLRFATDDPSEACVKCHK